METGYFTVFWYAVISVAVVPLMLGLGALLRPRARKKNSINQMAYECGEVPMGNAWVQFNIRFYVIAIVFLIFDVEVATVFPTMVLYKPAVVHGEAGIVLAKIFLFIFLLLVGLIYSWARGDLEWIKSLPNSRKKMS